MANEEFILGYQWSPETGEYLSEYKFPNNKDKDDIHVPPYTTLVEPPPCPAGYVLFWDAGISDWRIKKKVIEHPPIHDYAALRPEFMQMLKDDGMWSDEDEEKYQQAIKKVVDDQNKFLEEMDYEKEFRMIRTELLLRSDWTQMADVQKILMEDEKLEWDEYRQKLRDLPNLIDDPNTIKEMVLDVYHSYWPVSPKGSNWE
jgi:hypothetical protein